MVTGQYGNANSGMMNKYQVILGSFVDYGRIMKGKKLIYTVDYQENTENSDLSFSAHN